MKVKKEVEGVLIVDSQVKVGKEKCKFFIFSLLLLSKIYLKKNPGFTEKTKFLNTFFE